MRNPGIMVIGDSLLDTYCDCEVSKPSVEAALLPVHRVLRGAAMPGGAANVAANIAALGGRAYLFTAMGSDRAGEMLRSLLVARGIQICQVPAPGTPEKQRFYVGTRQLGRFDIDASSAGVADGAMAAIAAVSNLVTSGKIQGVVISDYAKGLLNGDLVKLILMAAASRGIPVFVDFKPCHIGHYTTLGGFHHDVTFKCNHGEAIEIAEKLNTCHPGLISECYDDVIATAARSIANATLFRNVFVTMSARGVISLQQPDFERPGRASDTWTHYAGHAVAHADPVGAGDTFLAALAIGRSSGTQDPGELASFAMAAAEVAVSHAGTYTPTYSEVLTRLRTTRGDSAKIVTLEDASAAAAAESNRSGGRVVMANGCFDGLHAGHIELLAQAKAKGTLLIAVVNDDASLKQLKGDNRPLVPQAQRLAHIAAVSHVDLVVCFNGDVEAVVRSLRPQVLVKGEDAIGTKVLGSDYVARNGGQVVFVKLLGNFHSSNLETRA